MMLLQSDQGFACSWGWVDVYHGLSMGTTMRWQSKMTTLGIEQSRLCPAKWKHFHESCVWNPRIFPRCSSSMMMPTYAHRYAAFCNLRACGPKALRGRNNFCRQSYRMVPVAWYWM